MLMLVAVLGLSMSATDVLKSNIDDQLMNHSAFYGLAATASIENSTTLCGKQLTKMADAIVNKNRWAIKMMDSSGMPKGGLYWGGTYWLGSRTQCDAMGILKNIAVSPVLGSVTTETVNDLPPFPVAYFAAYFKHDSEIQVITHLPDEFRITLGLCLPKSCEGPELAVLLQKYFDAKIFVHQNIYNATFQMQEVKKLVDDYSWLREFRTIIMGSIILGVVMMSLLGTIYDIKYYKSMTDPNHLHENVENKKKYDKKYHNIGLGFRILRCFSVYENNKIICSMKISNDSISVIHGLKFFSMILIILGHTVISIKGFYDNPVKIFYVSEEYNVQVLASLHFTVDTFFCISGYLLASSFFRTEYDESGTKKYGVLDRVGLFVAMFVKRFLRLTPSYMITVGLTSVIYAWRYRNSVFPLDERNDLMCSTYWWRNLLYINNLEPVNETCMTWSWYLGNDMQFFVITTFLLVLSTMYFKTAATLLTATLFGCVGYTIYLVYDLEFTPYLDEFFLNMATFYVNPRIRIGAYIVGVYSAYLVYYLKKELPLRKCVVRLLWIGALSMLVCILFGLRTRNVSLAYGALYLGVSRILWASAIAWALIACETQNGGIFTKILGFKYWYPFSRLTYVAYLLNPLVIFLLVSYSDAAYQMEVPNLLFMAPGMTLLSFLAAYVFTLLIESPTIALNKIFFDYLKSARRRPQITSRSARKNEGFESDENAKVPDEIVSKN
ncbi:nose resistant to fluoxetine protein 6-like [Arctopsyche grandis]|uniref:nose resistant to fluoxetine protein 6-like n=1 Tax=Arctopsyche grandis TaxID=121162 RepID=UPI00406D8AA1